LPVVVVVADMVRAVLEDFYKAQDLALHTKLHIQLPLEQVALVIF
jgi:hypothetical protein